VSTTFSGRHLVVFGFTASLRGTPNHWGIPRLSHRWPARVKECLTTNCMYPRRLSSLTCPLESYWKVSNGEQRRTTSIPKEKISGSLMGSEPGPIRKGFESWIQDDIHQNGSHDQILTTDPSIGWATTMTTTQILPESPSSQVQSFHPTMDDQNEWTGGVSQWNPVLKKDPERDDRETKKSRDPHKS
jgi:hypothetical protein